MNGSFGESKELISLMKSAYRLADALSTTWEIREIFNTHKEKPYEQWALSIHCLFRNVDKVIFNQCEVQLFYTAIYKKTEAPNETTTDGINLQSQIFHATNQLGKNLFRVIKKFDGPKQINSDTQVKGLLSDERTKNFVIELCDDVAGIILGDLGLRPKDLAKIY